MRRYPIQHSSTSRPRTHKSRTSPRCSRCRCGRVRGTVPRRFRRRNKSGGDFAFDHFQQRVEDQRVGLLDSSAVGVGDDDFQVGFVACLAATFAKELHGFYALVLRSSEGLENVWRISARRKTNQEVVGVGQSLDLSGENLVEAVVVANAGEQGGIGHEADGGKRGPMVPKVTDEFLGKMHGVSGAAAVAAREDLAARLERGDGGGDNLLKRILLGGEGLERAAGFFNQLWQNGFHKDILALVTDGAKEKTPCTAPQIAVSITASRCTKILLEFFMGIRFYTTCRWDGSNGLLRIDVLHGRAECVGCYGENSDT